MSVSRKIKKGPRLVFIRSSLATTSTDELVSPRAFGNTGRTLVSGDMFNLIFYSNAGSNTFLDQLPVSEASPSAAIPRDHVAQNVGSAVCDHCNSFQRSMQLIFAFTD